MAQQFKIYCRECEGRGKIVRTERQHKDYYKLYCRCNDVMCGFSWVSELTFSHALNNKPSVTEIIKTLLKTLPEEQLKRLKEEIDI